jgi:hypothetical protein
MGPHTLLLNGYQGSLPEVKWPRHEAHHSAPSGEEFKKDWSYTYILPKPPCYAQGQFYLYHY